MSGAPQAILELPAIRAAFLVITNRCNLECRHCYVESGPRGEVGLDVERLCELAVELHDSFGRLAVAVSGGEPLARRDDCIRLLRTLSVRHDTTLLTNATRIGPSLAETLCSLPIRFRVSIDVNRHMHEALRGPGSFERAVRGIDALRRAGLAPERLELHAAMAPGAQGALSDLLQLASSHEVRVVRVDALQPLGRGRDLLAGLKAPGEEDPRADAIPEDWREESLTDPFGDQFRTLNIFPDGEVYLHPEGFAAESLGNIRHRPLADVLADRTRIARALTRRVLRIGAPSSSTSGGGQIYFRNLQASSTGRKEDELIDHQL